MAVDLSLVRCYQGIPVLRVYGWRPPAVSLGYHQSLQEIDRARCAADGVDVVFRPTGGRAVLHDQEVTYAVILGRESRLFDRQIMTVYERISRGILVALSQLASDLTFERSGSTPADYHRGDMSSLCFASSVQHEIGFEGRKMIGSAQRRFGDVVLQHGSILLDQAHLRLAEYLAGKSEEQKSAVRRYMENRTACLNQLVASPVSRSRVTQALRQGFAALWSLAFTDSGLTAPETAVMIAEKEKLRLKSNPS